MNSQRGAEVPVTFLHALDSLRTASFRPEVTLAEVPAPGRIAPYSAALSAEVTDPKSGDELATGRFVLMHDPAGQPVWQGDLRLVTMIRAGLEQEMGADPLLSDVGWSWLLDALDARGCQPVAMAGTITRTLSNYYGAIAQRPDSVSIEIHASWTPRSADLSGHLGAWVDAMCVAAGLMPLPDGVRAIGRLH